MSEEILEAQQVVIRQGLAASVKAETVELRQAATTDVEATKVDASQSALAVVRAEEVGLLGSSAAVITARGNATVEQSAAGLVAAAGDATVDQSVAISISGGTVHARECKSVFVVAGKVEGEIKSAFGMKEALVFGAAAGVTLAAAAWLLPKAAVAIGALLLTAPKRTNESEPETDD